jgi:hypothetical protein
MNIEHWIFNGLLFSLVPMIYLAINLYKDNKKKDHEIRLKDKYIEHLEQKLK